MFKNDFSIIALALLFSIGLAGSALASGIDSSELDENDYADNHLFNTSEQVDRSYRPEVEQNIILVSSFAGGTDSSELDVSDYADNHLFNTSQQVDRSYRPEIEQNTIWVSSFEGGTDSSELDANDYAESVLEGSSIQDSKSVHCAGLNGTVTVDQLKDCG